MGFSEQCISVDELVKRVEKVVGLVDESPTAAVLASGAYVADTDAKRAAWLGGIAGWEMPNNDAAIAVMGGITLIVEAGPLVRVNAFSATPSNGCVYWHVNWGMDGDSQPIVLSFSDGNGVDHSRIELDASGIFERVMKLHHKSGGDVKRALFRESDQYRALTAAILDMQLPSKTQASVSALEYVIDELVAISNRDMDRELHFRGDARMAEEASMVSVIENSDAKLWSVGALRAVDDLRRFIRELAERGDESAYVCASWVAESLSEKIRHYVGESAS